MFCLRYDTIFGHKVFVFRTSTEQCLSCSCISYMTSFGYVFVFMQMCAMCIVLFSALLSCRGQRLKSPLKKPWASWKFETPYSS